MNYYKLGITLFISLVLSSVLLVGIYKLWVDYENRLLAEKLSADLIAMTQQMALQQQEADRKFALQRQLAEKQRKEKAIQAEKQRKEQARQAAQARNQQTSATQQKQRTCQFWQDQFAKTNNSYDKALRDTACR